MFNPSKTFVPEEGKPILDGDFNPPLKPKVFCRPPMVSKQEQEDAGPAASGSLAQTFGLYPAAAALTVIVDLMVFGADTFSFETLLPLGVAVAGVLGYIVYRMQRKWYGDDNESAVIKGLIIFLLTAIPLPLSPVIAIPAGVIGIAKRLFKK